MKKLNDYKWQTEILKAKECTVTMETKEEVKELKRRLKDKYKPVKSPIIQLIEYCKNRKRRTKLKEIEDLKLEIQKAKLVKELKNESN